MWGHSLVRGTEVGNIKFILKSHQFSFITLPPGPLCLTVKFTSIHAMDLYPKQSPKIKECRIIIMQQCAHLTKGPLSKKTWSPWITQRPNQIFLCSKWRWFIRPGFRKGCLINPKMCKWRKLTTIASFIEIQFPLNIKMKIIFEALVMMYSDKEKANQKTVLSQPIKSKITTKGYLETSPPLWPEIETSKWPR